MTKHKINPPKYMAYVTTWKCNSKCKMCGIWKIKDLEEMNLEEIGRIFVDSELKRLEEVILTGGEPFLREDLTDIARIVRRQTNANIGVTTNALLPKRVYRFAEELLKEDAQLGIYISLDGPTEEVHDYVRGVPGGFSKTISLIKQLVALRETYPELSLSTGMTLTRYNYTYAEQTKGLCDSLGILMGVRLNEIGGFFHNENMQLTYSPKERDEIIQLLKGFDDPNLNSYYNRLMEYLSSGVYPYFRCTAGHKSFIMDPTGEIYPCATFIGRRKLSLGNANENSFGTIWVDGNANKVRDSISRCYHCLNACDYSWSNNSRAT